MRWVILPLVLIGSIGWGCAPATSYYNPIPISGLSPVQPFTHDGAAVCTTWSIGQGYWVTANHCWSETARLGIAGQPAAVVAYDESRDTLLVSSPVVTPPLPRGTEPRVGDEIRTLGFPSGYRQPPTIFGRVALVGPFHVGGEGSDDHRTLVLNQCGGKGYSGGPVLHQGRVVGMLIGATHQHPCLDVAVDITELWTVVGTYWDPEWRYR